MLRVAIIEDSADVCALLRMTIDSESAGEVVGEAHDGYAGILLLQRTEPDVAVVDLHMPGMGGIELIQYLRARTNLDVKLVAYSGDPQALAEARRVGADAVVEKVGGTEALVQTLIAV